MKRRKEDTVCERIGTKPERPNSGSIIGLAIDSLGDEVIHGMRYPAMKNTNGWYIWSGDFKESEDFFSPVCIEHLSKYIEIDFTEYLDLPPGYRFLIGDSNYEDVWFDENLLNI